MTLFLDGAVGTAQLARLNAPRSGLSLLREKNPFYRAKLDAISLPLSSVEALREIPFTTKNELVADQANHPPYGTNLTFPLETYTRLHATSGTSGRKLKVLDTPESWAWFVRCWEEIFRTIGVGSGDRVFVAFGFGPFIGFWAGFEAAQKVGALAIPGGGQSSAQRLDTLLEEEATVLLSTPTYALRLAEVARESGIDLSESGVRTTLHAGEPGASIPSTRRQIEEAWGARCWDHAGMSEAGAWGLDCPAGDGMHVLESEFVAEVVAPSTADPVSPGETGELVLTNLGRWGAPAIRYRTGDLVRRADRRCSCGSGFIHFPGGVLGRVDDMVPVRGVNVYPSAIETILREERAVAEFRVEIYRERSMWEMMVAVEVLSEDPDAVCTRLSRLLESRLGLRAQVRVAEPGSLPRYELKSRRFVIRRD